MHYNLIFILLIFNIIFSDSNIEKYLWPTDASQTITTVFGDKRSRRFHAGIDVRTYGKIGDNLYAIESGHINRISISPTGYGKALYIKLNDGNTAVYAHIDKYEEKIKSFIELYKLFFERFSKIMPLVIVSGSPPLLLIITAHPLAAASKLVLPKGSSHLEQTTAILVFL